MALEIVWRNPDPPKKIQLRVEPLMLDEFGALYLVTHDDHRVSFELLLGGAA